MSRLPFELLLALRYLRPKRTFVSVITLISVLGVTLGVAVLIIVISVMTGFDRHMRDVILSFSPHLTITPRGGNLKNYQAVMKTIAANREVKAVAPFVAGQVLMETQTNANHPESLVSAPRIMGIDPVLEQQISVRPTNIIEGTFDVSGHGLIVGMAFADGMKLEVGDRVSVYSPHELRKMQQTRGKDNQEAILPDDYEVRGIFDVGYYEYNNELVLTSLQNAQDLYDLQNDAHGMLVVLRDAYEAPLVAGQLEEVLGPDYRIATWLDQNRYILDAVAVEKNVMFFILFFIMIVAALCILSALITFVVQKTREIGMLKAIGATDFQVAGLFLSQSAFIGAFGVLAGYGLGILAITYRNEFLHFMRRATGMELFPASVYGFNDLPALIVPGDILLICGSAFVICILGGLIPAWRAWRLTPVEALRYE
jgi:lipoprotein-releasing system permease protein